MSIQIISKNQQAYGAFNGGEIIENKPLGFPREGGVTKPYSSLFYWANAIAKVDSTIGLHPHQGFEIMSFVLEGTIKHYDTQLKDWKELQAGDAQIIRAGNGISHAEHMNKDSRMFQIWVDPNLNKTMQKPASYNDYQASEFTTIQYDHSSVTHYVGDQGLMQLDTKGIDIERWHVKGSHLFTVNQDTVVSLYALNGNLKINNQDLAVDDFILIQDLNEKMEITGEGELFIIRSQAQLEYDTYGAMMQRKMSS